MKRRWMLELPLLIRSAKGMSLTIQSLLQRHLEAYASRNPMSVDMLNAAVRMRDCRTKAMGGHINSCPDGHVHQVAYNSCHHRSCPQCNGLPRARWLHAWQARLLSCGHYHSIFTTPHEYLIFWQYNKEVFAGVLFASASRTLQELLADPKYLGGRVGLLTALHTWSQTLAGHVHLHILITAGGLDDHGRWVEPKKSCLLPRKVLMIKFRGKFRAMLLRKLEADELKLPPSMTKAQARSLINQVSRKVWNVKILEQYPHGKGVVKYLANYLRGGPIGNKRLLTEREGRVVFRYRVPAGEGTDRNRQGVTSLSVDEFLVRLLEHVPPAGFQTVRGYGLYSGNQHSCLDAAHLALGKPRKPTPPVLSWEEYCEASQHPEAGKCPVCGQPMISHDPFERARSPPPRCRGWKSS